MSGFNHKKLFQSFHSDYVARGRSYFERNRVEFVNLKKDGGLSAIVSGRQFYQVNIEPIVIDGDQWVVDGDCSCPVHYNCKHVVAALLEAEKKELPLLGDKPLDVTPMDERRGKGSGERFVEEWVGALTTLANGEQTAPRRQNSRGKSAQKRWLLYVFQPPQSGRSLSLDVCTGYLKKDGNYSQIKSFSPYTTLQGTPPEAVLPEDVKLLRQLYLHSQNDFNSGRCALQGEESGEIFEKVVATGRSFWKSIESAPLSLIEPKPMQLRWEEDVHGEQKLQAKVADVEEVMVLLLDPPYYRIPMTEEVGCLQSEYPPQLLARLDQLPAVPPEQVAQLQQKLEKQQQLTAIPRPRKVTPAKLHEVEPRPRLQLFMGVIQIEDEDDQYWWREEPEYYAQSLPMVELQFDYDGVIVDFEDEATILWSHRGSERLQIPRDEEQEENYRAQLTPFMFEVESLMYGEDDVQVDDRYIDSLTFIGGEGKIIDFCLDELPKLRKQGWIIEFSEDWDWTFAEEPEGWYAELDESESDWFTLGLEVDIDGQRVSLLPILAQFVANLPNDLTLEQLKQMPDEQKIVVRLDDGRLLPIYLGKVRTILSTLIELYDERPLDEQGRIRFNRLEAARMADLQAAEGAAHLRWLGGDRLLDLGKKLRDFNGIEVAAPPQQFHAELRDYQQTGLSWLQFLREMGLGGVLADDMGLGKTVQTLAHLLLEKQSGRMQGPSLVVAPTSLMVNWRSEAARFAPDLRVTVLHGADRKERYCEISESDIVLTTYPLVTRDHEELLSHDYYLLILDEAQVIKNPKARVTQLVHQIQAQHRLCLSGTPMENHLGELWSLMHFLNPGLLGDEKQFRQQYRNPIEKRGDSHRQHILQRRISPFLLRRSKQEVVLELPEKSTIIRSVELEGVQSKLYESIRLSMHKKIKKEVERKGLNRSHIIILDALLKLRQVCCDPRLLKLDAAKNVKKSAKLEMLMDLLPEMLEEGRRVLLFSQFTSMLKLIEDELKKKKIDYVKLTGQTRDRATPVERFQAGEVPLFLISLKAGGTGLNLTAADTVIHYDPWWNPAVENQATDRAHRIGQTNSVFVYKFITANTVEEKILELQQRKSALVEGLYGDGKAATGGKFSAEDLQMLFDPVVD
ncbi:MAG: DEAD/DEAH box helicase [Gammaproteobacteria bacterium]|nr:DEAD/DEAH box helicase [Gammaproteobacteria bacterium]MBT4330046.1 DEAD/DEAH box helicase [Gammaproteobacteria bacterium]